ncbi:MAG: arsenical pump-driving ATPase GET3 [candidate division KSB1 bacterium]|nr:arsenical pump-driving ATPase GET3 [candidate division KSB1 bacterium]MDZ7304324.1 arsenical pump-driving ATPase GET3 [candidate division KSB1 bacterium]MDZ7313600.1 arsenical pump-driving ATPase GET3 [candidate division KSB1 bacterium]
MRYLFGGKGGVGKTTISAAYAAHRATTARTLLVSTDTSPSLSDIFEREIGAEETRVEENLFAIEINAAVAMERYKKELRARIEALNMDFDFDVKTYLEAMTLSPGAQEAAVFDEFSAHLLREDFDCLVFDTAPAGETLRLLAMSSLIQRWMGIIVRTRREVVRLKEVLTGRFKDPLLQQLAEMKDKFDRVKRILHAPTTHLIFVLNPEKLPIEETHRAIANLQRFKFHVEGVVVNRSVSTNAPISNGLQATQARYLQRIREEFGNRILAEAPVWHDEPRGLQQLRAMGEILSTLDHASAGRTRKGFLRHKFDKI